MQHVGRNLRQRLHEQAAQREIDDDSRQQREDDRQPQDVHAVADHRGFERRFGDDDLDQAVVVGAAVADDANGAISRQQRRHRVAGLFDPRRQALPERARLGRQIVDVVDRKIALGWKH